MKSFYPLTFSYFLYMYMYFCLKTNPQNRIRGVDGRGGGEFILVIFTIFNHTP